MSPPGGRLPSGATYVAAGAVLVAVVVIFSGLSVPIARAADPALPGFFPGSGWIPEGWLPGWPGGSPPGPGHPATATPLTVGAPIASTSASFWGVVIQTPSPSEIASDPAVGAYLNSTPFHVFSYTLNTDGCNMSADLYYGNNGTPTHPCPFSVPAFAGWCESKVPQCTSIIKLPGENNNSSEDAFLAGWIVHDLGFQPTYWTIGNEPMLWEHYGIPWTDWRTTDRSHPTPLAYAIDLRNAIPAVQAVDPGARFIGIESDCQCSATDWMATVARVDGPSLTAVGYHTYPSTALLTNETLTQFFAPLTSPINISASYAEVRNAIGPQCPTCAQLPIFVTEYNSGPGRGATQWAGTYADAAFLAASVAQALTTNVTMFLTYNLQVYSPSNGTSPGWGLLRYNGSVGPEGILYDQFLTHLAVGTVYATSLPSPVGNVWTVATSNGSARSLLIVNANVTEPATIELPSLAGSNGSAPIMYSWSWAQGAPVAGAVPTSVVLPPFGMVLIDYAP